jgi:long-chain acyl-CoA synthetase
MTGGAGARYPTVVHMLDAAAKESADRVALRCEQVEVTYAQYIRRVAGFSEYLRARNVAGSRVALIMANGIDICVATFAIQSAGAQIAALNPAYTVYELEFLLSDCAPAAIVCDDATATKVVRLASKLGLPTPIVVGAGFDLARWNDSAAPLGLPDPASLSTLQYTGGTTGRPKGINLQHLAVATNVAQREALLPTQPDERILAVTPLYHSYALAMGLYLGAWCRGTLTVMKRYLPEVTLDIIERERITLFAGSATLFNGLMQHENFAKTDFSSLRLCFSGAAALPVETLNRWQHATGSPICEGYGQSEAGPILTFNPRHGLRKPGSVGIPLPGTIVEIVDIETGLIQMPQGEAGEIRACGPQIMQGYRDRPDETRAALRDGYLYTGDVGKLDDDGYLHILDRKKDMVVVAGFNVYPREIEEILCAHPAIVESAVIGVPDAYRGEALKAFVVLRNSVDVSPDDIQKYLAERLTRYKIPSDILVCAALPKTPVGKIDKLQLRAHGNSGP